MKRVKCESCGAQLKNNVQGATKCEYCGTEYSTLNTTQTQTQATLPSTDSRPSYNLFIVLLLFLFCPFGLIIYIIILTSKQGNWDKQNEINNKKE